MELGTSDAPIRPGDRFVHPTHGSWCVVNPSAEQVGMTGPGPCRSYKIVPPSELLDAKFGWSRAGNELEELAHARRMRRQSQRQTV